MKATDLSALISSRLCHDLISPIGAIANGLEIMAEEEDPEMIRQAVELLNHSVAQADRKLRFYRLAFGASAGAGESIDGGDLEDAARIYLREERVSLVWDDRPESLDKSAAKIIANLLLVGRDCLPRGGQLTVGGGPGQAEVRAEGEGARLRDEFAEVIAGPVDAPMPHVAPVVLLKSLLDELGGTLAIEQPGEGIRLHVRL